MNFSELTTPLPRIRAHERSENVDEDKEKARLRRAQRAALMSGVQKQTSAVTYDDKMQALAGLSEPWSNAACMGYCLMAMQQAGVPEPMQRKVLVCLEEKFDFYSLADAENAGHMKTGDVTWNVT